MRVFKNKPFARFARKNEIGDSSLCEAVRNANVGLIAADLGGGVIKQRIAREGSGKSGGFRTLILFRVGALAIFVHGFAKNDRDNIGRDELTSLRLLASQLLSYNDQAIANAVRSGTLIEVTRDEKKDKTVS